MSVLRQALRAAAAAPESLPEAGGWRRRYVFAANSVVFAGHFPQHPVVPGVAQILMAHMTLEEAFGRAFILCAVPQAKFTLPLEPGIIIELFLNVGRRDGLWDCTLHRGGQLAARFQLEVRPESV